MELLQLDAAQSGLLGQLAPHTIINVLVNINKTTGEREHALARLAAAFDQQYLQRVVADRKHNGVGRYSRMRMR